MLSMNNKSPFVMPTLFSPQHHHHHHSMHHRTLVVSPPSSPPQLVAAALVNATAPSMQSLAYGLCPQVGAVEKETKAMEVLAMKRSSRAEQKQQSDGVSGDEGMGWGFGEKENRLGDKFVDEILNLGDFKDECVEKGIKASPFLVGEKTSSSSSALSFDATPLAEISLPTYETAELEWVSYIMDDSFFDFPSSSGDAAVAAAQPPVKPTPLPPKPVDITANNAGAPTMPKDDAFSSPADLPVRARRSKRGRASADATAWSKSGGVFVTFPDASSTSSASVSSSASSCLVHDQSAPHDALPSPSPSPATATAKKLKPKKRGRKPKDRTAPSAAGAGAGAGGERRCSHCGVSKTPQWRAGPLGAKTLCNACGVRFKSGRLLPEYRPACSPQFESSMHSNSHRKVLEMRRKNEAEVPSSPAPAVVFF